MTISELCGIFRISRSTVRKYTSLGVIPPPRGRGPSTRYDRRHVEGIRAWRALQHNNVFPQEALRFCREEGISLTEFVTRKEQSIRDFGIGVA